MLVSNYRVTVWNFDSGLNELLNAQKSWYDKRIKRYVHTNDVKAKNDALCRRWIAHYLTDVRIKNPVQITYRFYVKDKKHDRSNVLSAFIKSFEDALQDCHVIENDTYDLVLDPIIHFDVDRKNPRVECEINEVTK